MSKRKLLLADDSITIQKVVNLTFADEGIDVVTVGDGDAALAHLASETPDILLADVNMPGPTGYEICEKLRANESTRGVPVILLVGSFEPFDEAEAARVGANAYLTKPFQSIKQLIAQVNELIDAASPTESEIGSDVPEPAELTPMVDEPAVNEAVIVESQSSPRAEPAPKVFDDLGYEVHAPAAEGLAPAAPAADDIDSLYERSVAGDDLYDVGIDDEIIETSYSAAQANDEFASFAAETATSDSGSEEPSAEPEVSTQPAAEYESGRIEGSAEASGAESQDDIGYRSGYEQRFPDDPSKFENTIAYENWQPADMREGDGATESEREARPQANSETLQPVETAQVNYSEPQSVGVIPETHTIGEDTIRMGDRFDTTEAAFKFDDVDLLDLSNGGQNQVEITSPVHAIEKGVNKQVVTLSPELIEMIAQRVVEKLSEKY